MKKKKRKTKGNCVRYQYCERWIWWAQNSLRSKRFRLVSEQRTRDESKRPKNGASEKAGRGWGTKSLVSFLARSKPKIPILGLSLLRNQTETLATQAKHKKLRYAVCQSYQHHHTSCDSLLASSHYSCHFKMKSFPSVFVEVMDSLQHCLEAPSNRLWYQPLGLIIFFSPTA